MVPFEAGEPVLAHAAPGGQHVAIHESGKRNLLLGSLPHQLRGGGLVLRHALAAEQHHGEAKLGDGLVLLDRLAVERCRLRGILLHHLAVLVEAAERDLAGREALVGRELRPVIGFRQVGRHAARAVEGEIEEMLGRRIAPARLVEHWLRDEFQDLLVAAARNLHDGSGRAGRLRLGLGLGIRGARERHGPCRRAEQHGPENHPIA